MARSWISNGFSGGTVRRTQLRHERVVRLGMTERGEACMASRMGLGIVANMGVESSKH